MAAVNDLPFIDEHRGLVAAPPSRVAFPHHAHHRPSTRRHGTRALIHRPRSRVISRKPLALPSDFLSDALLIIPMIIQTILLDPSGAVQVDAEHPSRNRKVEGSTSNRLNSTAA